SNLIGCALTKKLRFPFYILHDAADSQQRVLPIHHTAWTASLWLIEIDAFLKDIQSQVCPRRRAVFRELFCDLAKMRQRTLVLPLQNAKRPQPNNVFERIDAGVWRPSIVGRKLGLEKA